MSELLCCATEPLTAGLRIMDLGTCQALPFILAEEAGHVNICHTHKPSPRQSLGSRSSLVLIQT